MNKKADIEHEILLIFADFFILGMVFFALGAYVNSIRENTLLERKFLAADGKLFIEAAHAFPGNVFLSYAYDGLDKYDLDFKNSRFIVGQEKAEESALVGINKYFEYIPKFSKSNSFSVLKAGNKVYLGDISKEIAEREMKKLSCPLNRAKIDNLFITSADLTVKDISDNVFKNIDVSVKKEQVQLIPYEKKETAPETIKSLQNPKLLIFDFALENGLFAYINMDSTKYEEDYTLACLILNNIIDKLPQIKGAGIVPVNTKFLKEDNNLMLLKSGDSILIKFPTSEFSKNAPKTAQAVYDAIKVFTHE